ncbi:MAG: hypothetical protein FWC00_05040, partial [Firmicutes bacterium]|nr:hypothetical protein [Bacillota bacterium]
NQTIANLENQAYTDSNLIINLNNQITILNNTATANANTINGLNNQISNLNTAITTYRNLANAPRFSVVFLHGENVMGQQVIASGGFVSPVIEPDAPRFVGWGLLGQNGTVNIYTHPITRNTIFTARFSLPPAA